jgi:hypothetical protein
MFSILGGNHRAALVTILTVRSRCRSRPRQGVDTNLEMQAWPYSDFFDLALKNFLCSAEMKERTHGGEI